MPIKLKIKWNRAVYSLESNGHFDMSFEWDLALQDKWDKIVNKNPELVNAESLYGSLLQEAVNEENKEIAVE